VKIVKPSGPYALSRTVREEGRPPSPTVERTAAFVSNHAASDFGTAAAISSNQRANCSIGSAVRSVTPIPRPE
jgi:hypothetical protein